MDIYHQILKQYWGLSSFRPLQEEIIHSVCEGKDTLGLMPTGGGKSLTFQISALAQEGICIVVTPLIALMKDQVENLRKRRILATAVYTGMSYSEIDQQLDNCIFGDYKFLYVSPERLATDLFKSKLQAMKVCLLAIDESHCISHWGYDFRPSYLSIADIRADLPDVPVLALTATATPEVTDDIQDRLLFKQKNVFKMSFFRKNLAYIVRKAENKTDALIYILNRVPGTAIVYVRSRKRTQEIAKALRSAGIEADYFHAGLNIDEKNKRQDNWKNDRCRVIVSTNAFGMGIDKPDVRLVVHIDMPASLEEYYQEAGRAGRDGKKAYAVALVSGRDSAKLKKQLTEDFPEKKFVARIYEALCNYLQVAMGFGFNSIHDFDLEHFCFVFKFSQQQAENAIRLLELAGYLSYEEEPESSSRLMVIMQRDKIYDAYIQNKMDEKVLMTILRSYSGLFADYVHINESLIATRTGYSGQQVYASLTGLRQNGIIDYIPKKKTPRIIFLQSRVEKEEIHIPANAYEERKDRMESRVAKVLEYINEETVCRSRMLLAYFGEKDSQDCGCCDICQEKHPSGLKNFQVNRIRESLSAQLSDAPLSVNKLAEELPYPKNQVLSAIRFIADHDPDVQLENGMITKTEEGDNK